MRIIILVLLSIFSFDEVRAQSEASIPGWHMSNTEPAGLPWTMPEGIHLYEPIEAFDPWVEHSCGRKRHPESPYPDGLSLGAQVRVCLALENTTGPGPGGRIIKVVIPAGLTFIANNQQTQNGVLVQDVTVTIQPGKTEFVPLNLMCMNGKRRDGSMGDTFRVGRISQLPELRKLILAVQGEKSSDRFDGEIQNLVWKISTGKKISDGDLEAIGLRVPSSH